MRCSLMKICRTVGVGRRRGSPVRGPGYEPSIAWAIRRAKYPNTMRHDLDCEANRWATAHLRMVINSTLPFPPLQAVNEAPKSHRTRKEAPYGHRRADIFTAKTTRRRYTTEDHTRRARATRSQGAGGDGSLRERPRKRSYDEELGPSYPRMNNAVP